MSSASSPDALRASGSSSIYIASPEGDTGKSTIALGVLHRLAATVAKVGVFRPITRLGEDRDYILDLLLAHATAGLPYEQCVGVTYQQLHEDEDAAIAEIVDRYHDVADQCDAVVIVGSDYTDVATPTELSVNARIAVNLGAPVLLSVRAKGRTPEQVAQVVELCLAELADQHAHTAAVVANRCDPPEMAAMAAALLRSSRKRSRAARPNVRAARGAAAGRPDGGRPAAVGERDAGQRQRGADEPRGDVGAGGGHDRPSTFSSGWRTGPR